MPEVILPCPACGEQVRVVKFETLGGYIISHDMQGDNRKCLLAMTLIMPDRDALVAAWNALPRALTWTHEPPNVAGWYWRKETAADRAHVFHFTGNWEDYGEHWESDRVCQLPLILNDNLWAGPIAPPIE